MNTTRRSFLTTAACAPLVASALKAGGAQADAERLFGEGQDNGVTVVFKIDRPTGVLTKTNLTLDSPTPVCIAFV